MQPRPYEGGHHCRKAGARPNRTQHMSNATPDTRGAGGERRRRRSRGGKGRNRNRQDAQGGEQREQREPRQHHGHQHGNAQSRQERQDRGPRPSTYRPKEPVKLTLWQKILKAIGLYKEPVRPPRPEREERKPRLNIEEAPPAAVKSNVRNARQNPDRQVGERAENDRRRQQDRQERPEGGAPRRPQEKTEVGSPRIYLGNLSYDASEEDLKDLFKGIGTVRRVEVVYNRRTHKSKGYGFVDMLNMEEAKRSVEVLHDQFFMGRKLVVSGAKTKEYEEGQREDEQEAAEAREARKAAQAAQAAQAAAAAATAAAVVVAAAPEGEAAPAAAAEPVAEVAAAEEAPAEIPVEEPAHQLIFEEPEAPHQPHQH